MSVKVSDGINEYANSFNRVFADYSSQEDIFDFVKDTAKDAENGINTTIFTYGQTGSGKTFTIFGADWTRNQVPKRKKNNNGQYEDGFLTFLNKELRFCN